MQMRRMIPLLVLLFSQLAIAQNSLPEIACEFHTTVTNPRVAQVRRWQMWRSANQVQVRAMDSEEGERWTREADGRIFYQQVFYSERKTVEFTPGDLAAIHQQFEWNKLASLIDPAQLQSQLKKTGEKKTAFGYAVFRYRGRTKDGGMDLWWAPELQLPVTLRVYNHRRALRTELKAIHPLSRTPLAQPDLSGFEEIDFADLGDKESDPFVRRIEHRYHH